VVSTKRQADLISVVFDQIPRTVRDKVHLDVQTDAYMISPTVVVRTQDKRTFECELEPMDIEGVPVRCKVPDHFLSLLCVSVF
jgi:hypothetical protein